MLIPTATYRVQLNDHFTLDDLSSIVDYLYGLGISTVYASPLTTASRGSRHGYDVADPLHLNSEIGTDRQLEGLAGQLKEKGMSWLQDIVPNHMAYSTENPWLYDVLERGKSSPCYSYFDIYPEPVDPLGDRLMAPFLGRPPEDCLKKGELTLQYTDVGFVIRYDDHDFPVAAQLYSWVLTEGGECPGPLQATLEELVMAQLSSVEEWKAAKQRWISQIADDVSFTEFIRRRVLKFNKDPQLMATLLGSQHYALTYHRLSSSIMNYRRFFTVNSLICTRMEREAVFSNYHREIHRWWRRGLIQGLRIDHIDGLAAPREYINRLRDSFGNDCYIIAEKILARDERLPGNWDLQGMTGYEFLWLADQVLTDARGSRELLDYYSREIIQLPDFPDLVTERKHYFLLKHMGGELNNLFGMLSRLPRQQDARAPGRLRDALGMLLACFPVYRLYPDSGPLNEADWQAINEAFKRAEKNRPDCAAELRYLKTLFNGTPGSAEFAFISRFMQLTGPLAAKGIEDTSFYVDNAYISHNEVGNTPAVAGITVDEFHERMQDRMKRLPHSLNATTTHDTKRGEDARVRLNLLSAQPAEWIRAVSSWREANRSLIVETGGRGAPSANDEYLIYQALLGGFPDDGEVTDGFRIRFSGYLRKALREAKAETNYDDPDEGYEKACQDFAVALLESNSTFLKSFRPFVLSLIRESYAYSLAQLLIKLTAPGIPDIYQGAECWETSFVDPDNRREVDYLARIGLLRAIREKEAAGDAAALDFVLDHPEKSAMKIWVIYRALRWRREHPDVFSSGAYFPVKVDRPVLAYLRRQAHYWVLVMVPLISGADLAEGGFRVELPDSAPGKWTHRFTGDVHHSADGRLDWKEGWSRFPVAMLTAEA